MSAFEALMPTHAKLAGRLGTARGDARPTTTKRIGLYKLSPAVLERIWLERLRQQELLRSGKLAWTCATARIAHEMKLCVLTEELGELAQAIDTYRQPATGKDREKTVRRRAERIRDELTQVAACAIAWLECMEVDR